MMPYDTISYLQGRREQRATLFEVVSPGTLASLIADVELLGKGATPANLQLEQEARKLLVANVGEAEAERMIERACTIADEAE